MKILFVCTGNTCRSSMAEAIFNQMWNSFEMCNADNVVAFSAGTHAIRGTKTSLNSALVIKKNINIDISGRTAVLLTEELIKEADLVLTMTNRIKNLLVNNFTKFNNKIFTLNEYTGNNGEITDPFGMDIMDYIETYGQLKALISLLIDGIRKDRGICC